MDLRTCVLACGVVLAALPPPPARAGVRESLEKKLAKEFIRKAGWQQNYGAAKNKALADGKLILAYFTRSFAP